jgi:hypothetical protein
VLHVLVITLLIQDKEGAVLHKRAGGDYASRRRGLPRAGRAEQHQMLTGAQRQPGTVLTLSGHRDIGDLGRPRPLMHELALRAQIPPLPHGARRRGFPDPAARELVIA